jgi:hypothetical protein
MRDVALVPMTDKRSSEAFPARMAAADKPEPGLAVARRSQRDECPVHANVIGRYTGQQCQTWRQKGPGPLAANGLCS